MPIPPYFPPADAPDDAHAAAAFRFGFYCAACVAAGLDPAAAHSSREFSRTNPYVHKAIQNGDIAADRTDPNAVLTVAADGSRVPAFPNGELIFAD